MLTLQNITKAQRLLQIFFTRMEESYEENRYITQPPGETMPLRLKELLFPFFGSLRPVSLVELLVQTLLFCSGRYLWNASYRFCVSACSPLLPRALFSCFW